MRENVLRSVSRWEHTTSLVGPFEVKSAFYTPQREEPLVSLIVPAVVASLFTVRILLTRHGGSGPPEDLMGGDEIPAVAFIETASNRIAFHGTVGERDEYQIIFTNHASREVTLHVVLLVYQP